MGGGRRSTMKLDLDNLKDPGHVGMKVFWTKNSCGTILSDERVLDDSVVFG